jgi:hypothetical protein
MLPVCCVPQSPGGDGRRGRAMFGAMDLVAFVRLVSGIDDLRELASR